MHKKSWIISLLATGFMILLIMGITSVRAVENVQIVDILNDPAAYEGVEVEITGMIMEIDYGLLVEDASGAQLLISTGPMWYLSSEEVGLNLDVGETITVVGIVHTDQGANDQTNVHLAALEINGTQLREEVGMHPSWAGSHGYGRDIGQGNCRSPQGFEQSHNQGHNWNKSEVAAGLCGGGSLTGMAFYGFRQF